MKNAERAADDIKRFANTFKGLLDLADELEQIGAIEAHTAELKNQKEHLLSEVESLKSLTETINKENDDKILATKVICDLQKEKAEQLVEEIKRESTQILADSKEQADSFQMVKTSELQDLYEKQKQAKKDLEEIQSLLASESEKLAFIKSEINKIKGSL